ASFIKAMQRLNPGLKVCNLSRSEPEDFSGENSVHLSTDLSDPDALAASAATVAALIEEAPLGEVLLINNSAFGDYGLLGDLDTHKQLNMIDLNIRGLVDLTCRLLPLMKERGGVVVNIASTTSFQPTPYLATYGATKAFVLNWSLALNEDLRGTKVRALAVCPGPTQSNFLKVAGLESPTEQYARFNAFMEMTADRVVELTFRAIAKEKAFIVTGWHNTIMTFLSSRLPRVFTTRLAGFLLRGMRSQKTD
ncbi:MAG: SDR family NAD(P)-dependent oxidoreductase, partial [Verrucomicrobiota bacterium]